MLFLSSPSRLNIRCLTLFLVLCAFACSFYWELAYSNRVVILIVLASLTLCLGKNILLLLIFCRGCMAQIAMVWHCGFSFWFHFSNEIAAVKSHSYAMPTFAVPFRTTSRSTKMYWFENYWLVFRWFCFCRATKHRVSNSFERLITTIRLPENRFGFHNEHNRSLCSLFKLFEPDSYRCICIQSNGKKGEFVGAICSHLNLVVNCT